MPDMVADASARPAPRPRPSQGARRRRYVVRGLLVVVLALVIGLGTFVGGLLSAPIDFAVPAPPTAALLLAADGRQFATIPPPERRVVVAAEDIPPVMREAIISAEDERFLSHSGVDPLATVRAAFRDLTGRSTQGGSTLTQQYVKNVYVGNERTALRKVREAALAVRLERQLSKQEILTDYLNALYLGNGLYGVQAASAYYFDVPVKDLDLDPRTGRRSAALALARASIMAGIAPAPSAWNPVKSFATARSRQTYTLNRMVAGGYISPQQATDAFRLDVTPRRISPPATPTVAPEFADYVTARLKADPSYDEDVFFRGGLRVRTTLDLDLQTAAAAALKEVLPGADDPQGAVVAVDYRTGDVRAMATVRRVPERADDATGKVLSPAVKAYQRGAFNNATNAVRSTGSTIKPFTYAQALLEGLQPDTVRNGPSVLSLPNPGSRKPYVVHNSEPEEAGSYTLRRALAKSVNTVYVPLANEVGRSKVRALAIKAGLGPADRISAAYQSFGIGGGVEATPLSEAVAYGTFANGGTHVAPRVFTEIRSGASGTGAGQVLSRNPVAGRVRVLPQDTADEVVQAMTDVVQSGTATAAQQPFPVFGKTGTTDSASDAWFTGCIPDSHICIATWMGYEYAQCRGSTSHVVGTACGGMHDLGGVKGLVFGGTLPARIFARTQELLRQIKQARAAGASGLVLPTPSPSATLPRTPRVRRLRATPTSRPLLIAPAQPPAPSRTAPPTPGSTPRPRPSPTPSPTSRVGLPPGLPSPSPSG